MVISSATLKNSNHIYQFWITRLYALIKAICIFDNAVYIASLTPYFSLSTLEWIVTFAQIISNCDIWYSIQHNGLNMCFYSLRLLWSYRRTVGSQFVRLSLMVRNNVMWTNIPPLYNTKYPKLRPLSWMWIVTLKPLFTRACPQNFLYFVLVELSQISLAYWRSVVQQSWV